MKYTIIGAGATGSCIGGYLARAGYDVCLSARGEALEAIKNRGLTLSGTRHGDFSVNPRVLESGGRAEKPDVVFVCVKAYSLDEAFPAIRRICAEDTVVIPVLNGIGIDKRIREAVQDARIIPGCLYINARVVSPGHVRQSGRVFRLICDNGAGLGIGETMLSIAAELRNAGIDVLLSDDIHRDQFRKFMFVSALSATQIYFDRPTGAIQREGEERDFFVGLTNELGLIAERLGYAFPVDMTEDGKKRVDAMPPGNTTSLYSDLIQGKKTEFYEQIIVPIEMGRELSVETPYYCMVAKKMGCMN